MAAPWKVVRICGQRWEIHLATAHRIKALRTEEGHCKYGENRIFLREGLLRSNPTRFRDALLHELAHAWFESSGVGPLIHSNLRDGVDWRALEEDLIRVAVPHVLVLVDDLTAAGLAEHFGGGSWTS
jgi:hypothetical protein